jgi:beta-lactamase regulating signal transducer with metallopeptidase domain
MPWLSWVVSNVLLALVLALAAWVVQQRLRRYDIAHVLWVLVLVKLVTPPLVSVPLRESPGDTPCSSGTCDCGQHAQPQTIVGDTLPWILLGIWSAGAGATGWLAWCRWSRFRRLVSHARPAPPEWQALAARLASELSLRHPPEVLVVPGQLPPLVIPGWHRPRMLLPVVLLDGLTASQRVALLLHELVHIKRGDHRVRLLELAVGVVYWWLPVVGLIGRQLRACEEACCDAAVVARLPDARREYAALLLDVVDFVDPLPRHAVPQATAMSAARGLEQRLLAILDSTKGSRRTWPAGAFALGLAFAILPCELHYDLGPRPTSSAPSVERDPVTGATPSPGDDRYDAAFKVGCCPS